MQTGLEGQFKILAILQKSFIEVSLRGPSKTPMIPYCSQNVMEMSRLRPIAERRRRQIMR